MAIKIWTATSLLEPGNKSKRKTEIFRDLSLITKVFWCQICSQKLKRSQWLRIPESKGSTKFSIPTSATTKLTTRLRKTWNTKLILCSSMVSPITFTLPRMTLRKQTWEIWCGKKIFLDSFHEKSWLSKENLFNTIRMREHSELSIEMKISWSQFMRKNGARVKRSKLRSLYSGPGREQSGFLYQNALSKFWQLLMFETRFTRGSLTGLKHLNPCLEKLTKI